MNRIRITKIFHFEMAHALQNYDGACRHIHGHSYRLEVTVSGIPISDPRATKLGMVMDFGDLKRIVNQHIIDIYDHAFVVKRGYDQTILSQYSREEMCVVVTDYQPTSEMLIIHFADLLQQVLPAEIRLERLKLNETVNSFAEWCREDQ